MGLFEVLVAAVFIGFADGGELTWREEQRLLILRGRHAQIGATHGRLLREPIVRTVDSVHDAVGILDTLHAGPGKIDKDKALALMNRPCVTALPRRT